MDACHENAIHSAVRGLALRSLQALLEQSETGADALFVDTRESPSPHRISLAQRIVFGVAQQATILLEAGGKGAAVLQQSYEEVVEGLQRNDDERGAEPPTLAHALELVREWDIDRWAPKVYSTLRRVAGDDEAAAAEAAAAFEGLARQVLTRNGLAEADWRAQEMEDYIVNPTDVRQELIMEVEHKADHGLGTGPSDEDVTDTDGKVDSGDEQFNTDADEGEGGEEESGDGEATFRKAPPPIQVQFNVK